MNLLIIRIYSNVIHIQKNAQIPSVQVSELSQSECYKPVQETVRDQHPETTLEFPPCPPQR